MSIIAERHARRTLWHGFERAALAGLLAALLALLSFAHAPSAQEPVRRHIAVEISKGRIIRIDQPVKTVFIADPNIADVQIKSPTLIYLTGRRPGETTLIAVDEQDRILFNAGVTVNHNLSRLKRSIDAILPGNRVQVRSVDGAVVLGGEAESPLEVTQAMEIAARFVQNRNELVNAVSVKGPNMVNLRVRIVEMQRDVTRRIGIHWDAVFNVGGSLLIGVASGGASILGQGLVANVVRPGAFGIRYADSNMNLGALIDLLENDGYIKTLAQPNLSALSGKSANFLAGGEFPIPVPQGDGVITVEFKRFGVSLSFTPTILTGNRINLRVAPEVSQLSQSTVNIAGFPVPSLTTRRAETMVEVASGQSLAIAGLLQNNVIRDLTKVPWLSDVPVLGKLFTSESFRRNETELVVIVTPYIVAPIKELAPVAASVAPPPPGTVPPPVGAAPPAPGKAADPARFQLD